MHLSLDGSFSQARQEELEQFLRYENGPGQRLFASTIPSSLVSPDPAALLSPNVRGNRAQQKLESIYHQRREVFLRHLPIYGERSIHPKSTLRHYATVPEGHHLDLPKRHEQIENWIRLLEEHKHYEVGLTEDEPMMELGVKTTPIATIRGLSRNRTEKRPSWGIHHIIWLDEDSVFSFVLTFEQTWQSIPEQDRDKPNVIEFLKSLLVAGRSAVSG